MYISASPCQASRSNDLHKAAGLAVASGLLYPYPDNPQKNVSSWTLKCADCTFAACGGEIAFNFLYQSPTTPTNNNKEQDAMTVNTLQKPPPKCLIAF